MRHFQDIFVHCVMCPVIAIACKTFFLVFLKSRWIKWHKHDTSFHQKVVLESPIRTAARSVGEEHKHFSRQKNKRKGGQVLLDPQSFIWRIFLLHKPQNWNFCAKKGQKLHLQFEESTLENEKRRDFLGAFVTTVSKSIRYHSSFPEKSPKGETWQLKISLFFKATRL